MKVLVHAVEKPQYGIKEVEVNPDDTLWDLRYKIEDVLGEADYPAPNQLHMSKGRFLWDEDATLQELNIKEGGKISLWFLPGKHVYRTGNSIRQRPPKVNTTKKADLNRVAMANLSMCKDPTRLGIKVYSRKRRI